MDAYRDLLDDAGFFERLYLRMFVCVHAAIWLAASPARIAARPFTYAWNVGRHRVVERRIHSDMSGYD